MASVSLSKDLWDVSSVLDIYPADPNCTCVGLASTTGSRCRWPLDSEQFHPSQRFTAAKRLESMSELHPSAITSAALSSLAQDTLCRDFHRKQAGARVTEWKAKIENYLREHSERLEVASAVRQLQCDLDDTKKLQNGIAEERDASKREVEETRQAWESVSAELKALDQRNTKEVENVKEQLEGGKAKFERDIAASSQELRGLKESKTRLDKMTTANTLDIGSLKANVRYRDKTLDERARRSEEEVEDLRRQLAASSGEVAMLKEAKASSEEKAKLSEKDAESLRQELHKSNTRHEALEAKSSEDSKRLGEQLEALEQKYAESKDEDTARISQLQEQDRKIEQLEEQMGMVKQELAERDRHVEQLVQQMEGVEQESTQRDRHVGQLAKQMDVIKQELTERDRQVGQFVKQMDTVNQKLAEQEDKLTSSLQPQNVKKGLFAVISRQPPRVLVKKFSKIMRTESTPYVQSVA